MIRSEEAPWMAQAACRGTGTSLFFPERGESWTEAKAVCAGCPVRHDCLTYAIEHRENFGCWGGLSTRERRRLTRVRARERPINHGTVGGYLAHGKRSEPACDECLAAWAERTRRQRRAS